MPGPASNSIISKLALSHSTAMRGSAGDGGGDALEDAVILGVVLAAGNHEWFGSYLFQ
jgi:hypothetical protein